MSEALLKVINGVVRLTVHAQPGAKRNAVVGVYGDALKLTVSAPPVDGKANDAITDFVATCFGVSRRAVTVSAGHASRRKSLAIEGLSLSDAERRLRSLLSTTS